MLKAIKSGVLVPITKGNRDMDEETIYEIDVIKHEGTIKLVKPRPRALKKIPNSTGMVRRAIASATKDASTNVVLLDMTSISFSMEGESLRDGLEQGASKQKRDRDLWCR